jgi:hypothetical protein
VNIDDDYGYDDYNSQYARERAEANGALGHRGSCAYSAGGDCTCGVYDPAQYEPITLEEMPTEPRTFVKTPQDDDDDILF